MSFQRFSFSTLAALVLLTSSAVTGCEVDRPKGQFKPTPRLTTAPQGNSDLFDDAGSEPEPGSNGSIEDPVIEVQQDGGMPVPPDSPLSKVQGFYWLRRDIEFTYSQSALFQTVKVFNRLSHLALTQLVAEGQGLRAVERTCHVFYQHKCQSGCSSFSTTPVPDAAKLYRAQDLPRIYSLTNNSTMFVTDAAALVLGWTGPAARLPTSLDDPAIWNASNDERSKGFYLNVKAGGLPQVVDCFYNTVERFSSSYSGSLRDGSLDGVSATLATTDWEAKTLKTSIGPGSSSAACEPSTGPSPPVTRSTVRFAKVEGGAKFWDCPAIADFRGKLTDPPGAP